MKHDNGGPAFPAEGGTDSGLHADPGMTLHQYFAAAALTGLLNHEAPEYVADTPDAAQLAAEIALSLADAMIAEYRKRESSDA